MDGLLCLKWNNHSPAVLKKLNKLRLKELYCDATIICHYKYFPVHRLVLSTCSDYFETIFEKIKCKHPFIIVKDLEPSEMEALINYMYKGEVNVQQELLPKLIRAAELLCIKGLAVNDDEVEEGETKKSSKPKRISSSCPSPSNRKRKKHEDKVFNANYKSEGNFEESLRNFVDVADIKNEHKPTPKDLELIGKISEMKEEPLDNDEETEADFSYDEDSIIQDETDLNFDDVPISLKNDEPQCSTWQESADTINISNENEAHLPDNDAVWRMKERSWQPVENSERDISCSFMVSDSLVHEKRFKCGQCSYKTKTRYCLTQHIRKHTGEKPFQCQFCNYKATNVSNIRRHMRIHLNIRPFKCTYCNYEATQRTHLLYHIRRHSN